MRVIPLSRGAVTVVDDCDYPALSEHRWYLSHYGYAVRNVLLPSGRRGIVYMHREILGCAVGELNNRRENLRRCTRRQNLSNRASRRDSATGLKGVSLSASGCRWIARITVNKRTLYLGCFTTAEAAARAYDDAAQHHFGEFARINRV